MADQDEPVVPLRPEFKVAGETSQVLLETIARCYMEFIAEYGGASAVALFVMAPDGTTKPYYHSPGERSRSFLALAGLRFAHLAVTNEDSD